MHGCVYTFSRDTVCANLLLCLDISPFLERDSFERPWERRKSRRGKRGREEEEEEKEDEENEEEEEEEEETKVIRRRRREEHFASMI